MKAIIPMLDTSHSGGTRALVELANGLVQRGHQCTIVLPRGTKPLPFPTSAPIVQVGPRLPYVRNARNLINAALGKKVDKSREAVKYRITQLQKKGVIEKFITSINPNKLGYYMFKVYLKLENIPEERERFFEALKQNKTIYWMGISDGAFDCVFAILSKSITTYYQEINALLSSWRHLIVSKVLGTMVDTKQFNKKFFLNETDSATVVFSGDVVNNEIDYIIHTR